MFNIKEVDTNVLVDMLENYTNRYTELTRKQQFEIHADEIELCSEMMQLLVSEIDNRKKYNETRLLKE